MQQLSVDKAGMVLRGAAGVARRNKVENTVRNKVIGCTIDGDQEAKREILFKILPEGSDE